MDLTKLTNSALSHVLLEQENIGGGAGFDHKDGEVTGSWTSLSNALANFLNFVVQQLHILPFDSVILEDF